MTRIRTIVPPIWTLGGMSIVLHVGSSVAQVPVELTIDGLGAVVENSTADYTATALFDNGQEFEVTLLSDWSVEPDTYASMDPLGRLTTEEVPEDQQIAVRASFTWNDVTVDDELEVTIVDIARDEGPDPWPTWQRTNSRLGRTATIGPQTSTLAWTLQVDFHPFPCDLESRITLDRWGRLFCGVQEQVTCVDLRTRTILWEFGPINSVFGAPAVADGRVYFGDSSADEHTFYCVDAATGNWIWERFIGPELVNSSAAVADGVVYFNTGPIMYGLSAADGTEIWIRDLGGGIKSSPSLDGLGRLFHESIGFNKYFAFDVTDGSTLWEFPVNGYTRTTLPVEDGRVYGGIFTNSCEPRRVYCLDSFTGELVWETNPCENVAQGLALGWPASNTLYSVPGGSAGIMYAFDTDDGAIKWTYQADIAFDPPIVDGLNNVYFGSTSLPLFVWAVRSDGTELWKHPMPDQVFGSPILAPDGTLYVVCSDKNLYAFRDPPGDLDFDGDIDLDDFANFELCLTGPRLWGEAAKTTPGCELLDFDSDWDVDLTDLGRFQVAFTGPR